MSTTSKNPEAAQALIRFFTEPDARRAIIAAGMAPG
jgi:ABC-type Fe3+ transport system substrate-binding protein